MDDRDLAKYYAAGRVVVGLVLALFPGRALRGMLGDGRRGSAPPPPGVKALCRVLGVRDAILGAGTLAALQDDKDDHHVRRWMTYGAVADGADALSLLVAYRSLPRRRRAFMVLAALAGAGTGGYLTTTFDQPGR